MLNTEKLENIRQTLKGTTARCPACAEDGVDRSGNHLFISETGEFGCVLYPGDQGIEHRKKIFELVGIKEHRHTRRKCLRRSNGWEIRNARAEIEKQIKKAVRDGFGRFGRVSICYARKEENSEYNNVYLKESAKGVQPIQKLSTHIKNSFLHPLRKSVESKKKHVCSALSDGNRGLALLCEPGELQKAINGFSGMFFQGECDRCGGENLCVWNDGRICYDCLKEVTATNDEGMVQIIRSQENQLIECVQGGEKTHGEFERL
jgi:hypothetical protein